MQNIFSNAIKYRKLGKVPSIEIRAVPTGLSHVRLAIADDGIGFEEKYAQEISSPSNDSTTRPIIVTRELDPRSAKRSLTATDGELLLGLSLASEPPSSSRFKRFRRVRSATTQS
jgi:signal transduction histidine kinase